VCVHVCDGISVCVMCVCMCVMVLVCILCVSCVCVCVSCVFQTAEPVGDICRKWHVAPTLSVDFVGYYLGL